VTEALLILLTVEFRILVVIANTTLRIFRTAVISMSVTLKRVTMKILFIPILATALASTVAAQDVKEFLGRWDMTVTPATGKPYPQWMELTDNGGKIEGRVQPRGGAWRPIVGANMESGKLIVTVGEAGPGSTISWSSRPPVQVSSPA